MLDESVRAKGVIAASAGNQDISGAGIILFGDSYNDAYAYVIDLAQQQGRMFIHPFDDPNIIAGQGTIALENLRQHPGGLDAIVVSVGVGTSIASIAVNVQSLARIKCLNG